MTGKNKQTGSAGTKKIRGGQFRAVVLHCIIHQQTVVHQMLEIQTCRVCCPEMHQLHQVQKFTALPVLGPFRRN